MSLFKLKEWWGIKPSSEEECDFGCLFVANIDNGSNDKIIVGSYHGILHIYCPSESGGKENPHDIMLESQLKGPILQVAAGKFLTVSSNLHLAVLQPRNISIYAVTMKEGAVDHGHQSILNKIYEHKLERTAANIVFGPFGGVKETDFLCVQSMDGTLSIFESENFTFTRFIPGFLMPGPLAYCAKIDSFITVSSNRELEAYSFQVLAVAVESNTKEESRNVTTGKKINADWKLNIGETALDIRVVSLKNDQSLIMVLGERNLFCVKETGQLNYMKRLEYSPSCFYPFVAEDGENVSCLVCTHSRQLLLYEGISLKWATMLDETAVQVAVGTFRNTPGMIVTLTDQCHVSCSYLGTHPSMFNLPQSTQREMNYGNIEQEMANINNKIKHLHISKGDALSQAKESEDLTLKVVVPPTMDRVSIASQHGAATAEGPVPSITVQIILKATRRVTNVQIAIHVDEPIACTQKRITIPAIVESEPSPCAFVSFFLHDGFSPSTLSFEVVAHYHQVTGIPKIVGATGQLPLALVAWPHDPIKTMDHKVTLETNKACVNLLDLFPELTSADAGPNCVAIKLIHGSCSTILTSKSSNRYRVQSETYAGLWLLSNELVKRLKAHPYGHDLKITHSQPVNLQETMLIIDRHFQLRLSRKHVTMMLEQRAKQFRAIQRRLLTRFKDKTPAPLICLDTLLEGTYRQILTLADACEENYQTLLMANAELSCALRLLVLLTTAWLSLSEPEATILESTLLCVNFKDTNLGWEEIVDSSLTTLIRTVLNRGKDSSALNQPQNSTDIHFPDDISKVKKHLGVLFDRLSKGARITGPHSITATTNHKSQSLGPISNISIKQGQSKHLNSDTSLNSVQHLPLSRGISEEINEEDEKDIIDDIISSTPSFSHSVQPPVHNLAKENREDNSMHSKPPTIISETIPEINCDEAVYANDDDIESPAYDNSIDDILSM